MEPLPFFLASEFSSILIYLATREHNASILVGGRQTKSLGNSLDEVQLKEHAWLSPDTNRNISGCFWQTESYIVTTTQHLIE